MIPNLVNYFVKCCHLLSTVLSAVVICWLGFWSGALGDDDSSFSLCGIPRLTWTWRFIVGFVLSCQLPMLKFGVHEWDELQVFKGFAIFEILVMFFCSVKCVSTNESRRVYLFVNTMHILKSKFVCVCLVPGHILREWVCVHQFNDVIWACFMWLVCLIVFKIMETFTDISNQ